MASTLSRWPAAGLKWLAFHAGIYRPDYPYKINPIQLAWLIEAIEKTRSANPIQGCIVEAGVASGMTSYWLAHHLHLQYDKRLFVGIDTFKGFMAADVDHEIKARGKTRAQFKGFTYNGAARYERNLSRAGYQRCAVYQCPIQDFNWELLPPVDVLLLDVDLYMPTRMALRNVQHHMNQSSFIMIDDCWPDTMADGALQAYLEFCRELNVMPSTAGLKGGLIEFRSGVAVKPESVFISQLKPAESSIVELVQSSRHRCHP